MCADEMGVYQHMVMTFEEFVEERSEMFGLSFSRLLGNQKYNPEEAIFQNIEGYRYIEINDKMYCII